MTEIDCGTDTVLIDARWIQICSVLQECLTLLPSSRLCVIAPNVHHVAVAVSAIRYATINDLHWKAVCPSADDQSQTSVSAVEYELFRTHSHRFSDSDISRPVDFDSLEKLVSFMIGEGKVDVVVLSEPSTVLQVTAAVCSLKAGGCLIVIGQSQLVAEGVPGLFANPIQRLGDGIYILSGFQGLVEDDKELLKSIIFASACDISFVQSDVPSLSLRDDYSPLLEAVPENLEISSFEISEVTACSSFAVPISIKLESLTQTARNAYYAKGRRNFQDEQPLISSPYLEIVNLPEFKKSGNTSLACLDVLVNVMHVDLDLRYDSIFSAAGGIWGIPAAEGACSLAVVDDLEILTVGISMLKDGGDLIMPLKEPLVLSNFSASLIFRFSQFFRQVNLARSSACPSESFIFARGLLLAKFKKSKAAFFSPTPLPCLWDPEYLRLIRGFNHRVLRDACRPRLHGDLGASALGLKRYLGGDRVKVGVYFGSFDPPHENHASLVSVAESFGFRVVIVPNSGANEGKAGLSAQHHREAMVKLRFGDRVVTVNEDTSSWEVKQNLAKKIADKLLFETMEIPEPVLLVGEDSFRKGTLKRGSGIFKLRIPIVVFPRSNEPLLIPDELNRFVTVATGYSDPLPGLSSSLLRSKIGRGEQVTPEVLRDDVLRYIITNELYQAEDDDSSSNTSVLIPD